ncbi:hypothetical protein OROGR_014924 [Orobanche gracilis]
MNPFGVHEKGQHQRPCFRADQKHADQSGKWELCCFLKCVSRVL